SGSCRRNSNPWSTPSMSSRRPPIRIRTRTSCASTRSGSRRAVAAATPFSSASASIRLRPAACRSPTDPVILTQLQQLIGGIYDVSIAHDVYDFLVTDRRRLPACVRGRRSEEDLIVAQPAATDGEAEISLYLDAGLLERLQRENPMVRLHDGNVADYWKALEGVSHFLYLAWNAGHDRPVSILELEMQAEVDKCAASYPADSPRSCCGSSSSARASIPGSPRGGRTFIVKPAVTRRSSVVGSSGRCVATGPGRKGRCSGSCGVSTA